MKPAVIIGIVAGVLGLGGAVAWAATSKKTPAKPKSNGGGVPAFTPGVMTDPYVPASAPAAHPAYVPDNPAQPYSEVVSNAPTGPSPYTEVAVSPGGGGGMVSNVQAPTTSPSNSSTPLGETYDKGVVSNTQSADDGGFAAGSLAHDWRDARVALPAGAKATALREGRGRGRVLATMAPGSNIRVSGDPVNGWMCANVGTKIGWVTAAHVQG